MAQREDSQPTLKLALPKGHMQAGVIELLADAGIQVRQGPRDYRPTLSVAGFEAKMLKPQNIVEMLHAGSRDAGFAGVEIETFASPPDVTPAFVSPHVMGAAQR